MLQERGNETGASSCHCLVNCQRMLLIYYFAAFVFLSQTARTWTTFRPFSLADSIRLCRNATPASGEL